MKQLARDDEAQLIARSQQGDVEAFNQLIIQYQQILYGTIFRLLGDYDTASDVTQDAFIAAFRSIRTFRGNASFRAWLLRIGSNLVYDHWRRLQRHPASSLEAMNEEDDDSHGVSLLDTLTTMGIEGNPEEAVLTQELQAVIQQGLQQLPLEQRTVIVLCDIQGLAYEEVAHVTETTMGTVRSRISRGRARLRTYLQQHKELLPQNYRLTNSND
jgi:RNA polymerase sigma-70 factor (ECF subfamily)